MSESLKETPAAPAAEGTPAVALPAGGFALWKASVAMVAFWFVVDHATKYWAIVTLKPNDRHIQVIPGMLRLLYRENTGAAFSVMTGQTFLLGIVSFVAIAGLSWYWYTLPKAEAWGRMAVALVLSGAAGNMVDRFFRAYVVDFVEAYYRSWSWPVFNVADSCICVGATILAVQFLRGKI